MRSERKGRAAPRTIHTIQNPFRIRIVSTAGEAERLLRGGYCPVECSFGPRSVVCRLRMDHHGPLHDLPGVAVRAYTESFASRAARPWFALTGHPDEDVTWALGSLAGLLPHPDRDWEFRGAPPEMRRIWTRDWTALARLINRVDTNPSRLDLTRTKEGRIMLLWRLQGSLPLRDALTFYAGVDRWRSLLIHAIDEELEDVPDLLRSRLERTRALPSERFGRSVALINTSVYGFSTVYAWDWFEHCRVPVVFAFQPRPSGRGIVTVCVRDGKTAENLYGEGGLLNLFPRLEPRGWGGRPVIGGSSRGKPLTWEQARQAARTAARLAG